MHESKEGMFVLNALAAFFPMNAFLCFPPGALRVLPPAWETLCVKFDQATGCCRGSGCMSGAKPPLFTQAIQLLLCSLSMFKKVLVDK